MAEEKNENIIVKWVGNFQNIALALIAVATGYNSFQNDKIKTGLQNQLAQVEINKASVEKLSSEVHLQIDQKRFSNEQLFGLYREIKESVNQKDCDQQILLTMIVDQVMADNISLRDSLRNFVLKKDPTCSAAQYIKKEKHVEAIFENQQKESSGHFTIDVFYLDEIVAEAKPRAERIVTLLKNMYPDYTIRLRLLPKSVNARNGYRIESNQVRFEAAESKIAKEVFDSIVKQNIFQLEQPALNVISYHTQDYISIFVRNM
ncbi:MAG TPA: hypothetical protein VJY62_06795 [Bacteroidia bacterium]|nr:hypothetical protein [Bacteroidia bacterium]